MEVANSWARKGGSDRQWRIGEVDAVDKVALERRNRQRYPSREAGGNCTTCGLMKFRCHEQRQDYSRSWVTSVVNVNHSDANEDTRERGGKGPSER